MGDATGPGTPGSSDAPGDCTPRCRRPPRPRRTARQQTTTESTAISYGTAQAGAQTLAAGSLRDFRVPFVSGTNGTRISSNVLWLNELRVTLLEHRSTDVNILNITYVSETRGLGSGEIEIMLLITSLCADVFLRNTLKPNVLSLTECHSFLIPYLPWHGAG